MIDFVGLLVLVVLVALFAYLAFRAWGSKNAILKWVGLVLSALLTLIFALLLILAIVGTLTLNQNYNADHPPVALQAAAAPDTTWGEKYATLCAGCHSPNESLPLVGNNFGAAFPLPIGTLYAPNLTPSGEIKDWSDAEVIRAIREGVHKSGRSLIIMPAQAFHGLSDNDVQNLVAYLRTQPPAPQDTPRNNLNVVGAIFLAVTGGGLETVQPHITQPIVAPQGATVERGAYLVSISGCHDCHGPNLAGGVPDPSGAPIGPNLTTLVPKWSQDDFVKTIRTGVDPTGHSLDAAEMPWPAFSGFMTDDDVTGLYMYLHGLQELPTNPSK